MPTESKEPFVKVGKQAVSVGFLGALITATLNIGCPLKEQLLLAVPFTSVLIVSLVSWFFILLKFPNAEAIQSRRNIKSKMKSIDAEMKSENVSSEAKTQLQGQRDKLSLALVDIDDHR